MVEMSSPSISLQEEFRTTPFTQQIPQEVCRDRYGRLNSTFFPLWACSLCYTYLFPEEGHLVAPYARWHTDLRTVDGDRLPVHIPTYPDLFRPGSTEITKTSVCRQLGEDKCHKLSQCCNAAVKCCKKQLHSARNHPATVTSSCPFTWDGFACFRDTPAGNTAHVQCPSYVYARDTIAVGTKTCLANGTWYRSNVNGKEWTDYSLCVNIEGYRALYYAGISLNVISLVCLVPACIIFLTFKQLLKQHRIRIHLNLFLSFILTNASWLCWEDLVYRDRLENIQDDSFLHTESALCRLLYVITRYAWSCNFAWMSLEGLHLYRLINHAFKAPKTISSYYFIGWLLPCLPICVYGIIRWVKMHSGCWVYHAGFLEWIMYGPNLLCVMLNVIFLVIILKILLTQLQTHPNEPSNYRRALKATFILVPLFGLQLFLYVYRPLYEGASNIHYEMLAKIITNSQGATVAIVFCFFNSEVHSQVRSHLMRSRSRNWHHDARSYTFSTDGRRVSAKGSNVRLECMPLTNGPSPSRDTSNPTYAGVPTLPVQWRVSSERNGHAGASML